eukprot:g310.t1
MTSLSTTRDASSLAPKIIVSKEAAAIALKNGLKLQRNEYLKKMKQIQTAYRLQKNDAEEATMQLQHTLKLVRDEFERTEDEKRDAEKELKLTRKQLERSDAEVKSLREIVAAMSEELTSMRVRLRLRQDEDVNAEDNESGAARYRPHEGRSETSTPAHGVVDDDEVGAITSRRNERPSNGKQSESHTQSVVDAQEIASATDSTKKTPPATPTRRTEATTTGRKTSFFESALLGVGLNLWGTATTAAGTTSPSTSRGRSRRRSNSGPPASPSRLAFSVEDDFPKEGDDMLSVPKNCATGILDTDADLNNEQAKKVSPKTRKMSRTIGSLRKQLRVGLIQPLERFKTRAEPKPRREISAATSEFTARGPTPTNKTRGAVENDDGKREEDMKTPLSQTNVASDGSEVDDCRSDVATIGSHEINRDDDSSQVSFDMHVKEKDKEAADDGDDWGTDMLEAEGDYAADDIAGDLAATGALGEEKGSVDEDDDWGFGAAEDSNDEGSLPVVSTKPVAAPTTSSTENVNDEEDDWGDDAFGGEEEEDFGVDFTSAAPAAAKRDTPSSFVAPEQRDDKSSSVPDIRTVAALRLAEDAARLRKLEARVNELTRENRVLRTAVSPRQ